MSTNSPKSKTVPERCRERRRSRPNRGSPSIYQGEDTGLGDVYLETFSPPTLASSSDVYFQVYAVVRAILERVHWRHATSAVKAARDAAVQHVERCVSSGGQDDG